MSERGPWGPGGGRRGGSDLGGRRGGRGGGGGGGGRRGGPPPQQQHVPASIADPRTQPSSSRANPAASSQSITVQTERALSAEVEKMAIGEAKEEEMAVTARDTDELVARAPSSEKAYKHPARPGYGTAGIKCVVLANHFLVQVANRDLCQYDVAITPEVTSRSVCRSIIAKLVDLHKGKELGRFSPAYDGRKSLYTAGELPFASRTFTIKLTDGNREREFNVAIKLAGRADLNHLQQFLQGRYLDTPQDTIQVLDVVLRESPSRNYVTVSRSFFSPEFGHRNDIGDGLECWRGYYQSLRPTQMGLSLNIDISATSFYKPVPVLEFAAEYLRLRDISRGVTDRQRVTLKKALSGLRVQVTHRGDSCVRYKIKGITTEPLARLSFIDDNGNNIKVLDYFQDKYQYRIRHSNWPCLQSGSDKRPTYLPIEVCTIVEGQRYSKKLNEQQVTEILRATCQRPQQRKQSINEMVRRNNYKNDKFAVEFGINVKEQLALVDARVLPPPTLKYHDTGKEKICNPRVGAWNMINKKMVKGGKIDFWACISFARNLRPEGAYQFCDRLFNICNTIGMQVNQNAVADIFFEMNFQNVEGSLRKAHTALIGKLAGRPLQLLLVILPEMTGAYAKIKRVCETELGIVSQCCLPRHAQQCKPQYMENVALKINVKVGGTNTVLADFVGPRKVPLVTDVPTIFFGADVTHPSPGEDSSPSIAAVVASMDWPQVTYYKGLVSAQPHRQEMIQDLYTLTTDPRGKPVSGGLIRELLISFYKKTNRKPERIIFYRDGVSEGQFSQVLLYEIDAIRSACASIQEGYLPPITFVVVQKRHHTRLFPEGNNNTDRSGNIMPGTVVDRVICHPTEFDFYLCSHAGIQGTSRPTHYHVLFDENKFSADGLQILTNNLCYTYARCTRSVSVVPPAYYAHLAAFRARYYVEGDTEGESSAGGTRARTAEPRPLPKIKDNVKEFMFYC